MLNQGFKSSPRLRLHPVKDPLQSIRPQRVQQRVQVQRGHRLRAQVDEQVKVTEKVDDVIVGKVEPVIGQGGKVLDVTLHGPVLDGELVVGHVEGVPGREGRGSGNVNQQVLDRQRTR